MLGFLKISLFHYSALPGQGRVNGNTTANSQNFTTLFRSMMMADVEGRIKEGWRAWRGILQSAGARKERKVRVVKWGEARGGEAAQMSKLVFKWAKGRRGCSFLWVSNVKELKLGWELNFWEYLSFNCSKGLNTSIRRSVAVFDFHCKRDIFSALHQQKARRARCQPDCKNLRSLGQTWKCRT